MAVSIEIPSSPEEEIEKEVETSEDDTGIRSNKKTLIIVVCSSATTLLICIAIPVSLYLFLYSEIHSNYELIR